MQYGIKKILWVDIKKENKMKTLKNKTNETAEESWERKAKILDRLYSQFQMSTNNELMDAMVKIIERFNQISINKR